MRDHYRRAVAVAVALIVLSGAGYSLAQISVAQDNPEPPAPPAPAAPEPPAKASPNGPAREPTVTVLDKHDVQGIVGREVRGAGDENMGRIVDVIVDQVGQARAAIIDFGGFLGVGSRKIAVDWNALRFAPNDKQDHIALELTRDQVRAAPEYKEDKHVVVLGASGNLESLPYQ
jgi:hypothetical protein